jgi:molecular chaperone GrpE
MQLISLFWLPMVTAWSSSGFGAFTHNHPAVVTSRSTSTWLQAASQAESAEGSPPPPPATAVDELNLPNEGATDILNSPAFLKRKLELLKADIAKAEEDLKAANVLLEQGKAEWGPQLDDLSREYKNIQERLTNRGKQGDSRAIIQVARTMLDVLDNFDRAFGVVAAQTEEEKEIEAAYRRTYEMILEILNKLGVKEIETVGKEFDYTFHQAVMQRPSDEFAEGIVCEQYAKGFVLGDTLIRAAMVAVAA